MRIRVTSVASEEVGATLGSLAIQIQEALHPFFANKSFGNIEQFIVVIVAVDSDPTENNRFAQSHNKVGSYKDLLSNERVRYISIALQLNPDAIKLMSATEVRNTVCALILERSERLDLKLPKTFDDHRFSEELSLGIKKLYSSR